MEPLPIATVAGLTPADVELRYFDERIEPIDFDEPTDLVGVSVETYTAKRSYEIAAEYRKRGVQTVLGGYHVMLLPNEAQQYADSIVTGYAEGVWDQVIRDAEKGFLKPRYTSQAVTNVKFGMPRRDIFRGKPYFGVHCVETGRGCPFRCNFCSIMTVTQSRHVARPIDTIIKDVSSLENKTVFFVDDNIVGNFNHVKALLRELIPLKIRWVSQGSLNVAKDEELLQLMAESGCLGILVGFESLKPETLRRMDKGFMTTMGDIKPLVDRLHQYGIAIYGTFIYGYDTDSVQDFEQTVETAIDCGIFMAAFNHLVPFPGTPLYHDLRQKGQLADDAWWLDPNFRFNDVPFFPEHISREEVREVCLRSRRRFYGLNSILRRAWNNRRGNLNSFTKMWAYVMINALLRKEIRQKDGLPLGNLNHRPIPITEVLPHELVQLPAGV